MRKEEVKQQQQEEEKGEEVVVVVVAVDREETGTSERNTAYFAFYSRVPDSPESGALITVVNCCLGRGASPWQ